jgi:hypothetical protein
MNLIGVVLILIIGAAFILMAVLQLLALLRKNDPALFLKSIAYAFVIIGGIGFFGTTLSAVGGLNRLPETFEWPIGKTRKAIELSDCFVVPHPPSGRIQVYDKNLKFLRGWHIGGRGGAFKVIASQQNLLDVYTARGARHFVFDLSGKMIDSGTYSPGEYASFVDEGVSHFVPTAPWLMIFSNPLYSWILVIVGLGSLIMMDKMERRQRMANAERQRP